MAEKTKADIYMTYLDQILAGENDIGPVEDEEIAKLLLLAKAMIAEQRPPAMEVTRILFQLICLLCGKDSR